MRTVSFSEPSVSRAIDEHFVATYSNTAGDPTAGSSFSHAPDERPGFCGRGAGRQNVQTFFMTSAGEIFHVATGFLSPQDLVDEMQFALKLFQSLDDEDRQGSEQRLVSAQQERLADMGFSRREMQSTNPFQSMMVSVPNPADIGIQTPGVSMFDEISRQRVLQDAQYVMQNPLVSKPQFEKNPGDLVGHHQSFFGSNSAMSGLNQPFNGMPQFGNRPFSRQRP